MYGFLPTRLQFTGYVQMERTDFNLSLLQILPHIFLFLLLFFFSFFHLIFFFFFVLCLKKIIRFMMKKFNNDFFSRSMLARVEEQTITVRHQNERVGSIYKQILRGGLSKDLAVRKEFGRSDRKLFSYFLGYYYYNIFFSILFFFFSCEDMKTLRVA